jgi:DUF4097 and DUF4098 domain-containing protein YvlB
MIAVSQLPLYRNLSPLSRKRQVTFPFAGSISSIRKRELFMRLNSMLLLLSVAALLFAESQPGSPGRRIEVRAANAPVEITGSDIDRLQVDDPSHATVDTSGGVTLVTGDGAPLKLQVPRRSSLDVSTANGAIHISGVTGTLRLTTSNGAIIVQNAGPADLYAHTSNGPIEIGIQAGMNANLSARTSNGRIYSDVEVVTNRIGATFLEGKIGRGGPALDLQTSNASIHLRNDSAQESVNTIFKSDQVK